MAFSELQNDPRAFLKKIEAGLSLWKEEGYISHYTAEDDFPSPLPFETMHEEYVIDLLSDVENKFYGDNHISSEFPYHELVFQSKLLSDSELFEAILFSRIFDDANEFELYRGQYERQFVWVRGDPNVQKVKLIAESHRKIVYSMDRSKLAQIRRNVSKTWTYLKRTVEDNLREAFGITILDAMDVRESNSNSVPSEKAAPSCNAVSAQAGHLAEEARNIILDELNSIKNLDPLIKHQFLVDLKVLLDKDMYYWRYRLDCLRSSGKNAAFMSEELKSLVQAISNVEKAVKHNKLILAILTTNLDMALEKSDKTKDLLSISKLEQIAEDNKNQLGVLTDTLSKLTEKTETKISEDVQGIGQGEKLQSLDSGSTEDPHETDLETYTHDEEGSNSEDSGSTSCIDSNSSSDEESNSQDGSRSSTPANVRPPINPDVWGIGHLLKEHAELFSAVLNNDDKQNIQYANDEIAYLKTIFGEHIDNLSKIYQKKLNSQKKT